LAVLDIPLLFETRRDTRGFDAVLVVSAPAAIQAQRVLRRPGMTPARLAAIRARQLPDLDKRRRADHVIRTGLSRHHATAALRRLILEALPHA
jgi:dephospho-CoA kinase